MELGDTTNKCAIMVPVEQKETKNNTKSELIQVQADVKTKTEHVATEKLNPEAKPEAETKAEAEAEDDQQIYQKILDESTRRLKKHKEFIHAFFCEKTGKPLRKHVPVEEKQCIWSTRTTNDDPGWTEDFAYNCTCSYICMVRVM